MPIVDLHCDTLTVCQEAGVDLTCGQTQLSLDQIDRGEGWCQAFAVFIPDENRGQAAVDYFCRNLAYFRRQLEKFPGRLVQVTTAAQIRSALEAGKAAALLTVEGGCVLEGKEERIPWLAEEGVRMLTLTWNGANELAGGVGEDTGLTEFGRAAVPLLEDNGIVVDLSHVGERTSLEAIDYSSKPCIFSHSNTSRFPEFSYQENGKEAVHYELVKNVPVFYDELRAFADYWIKDDREAFRQRLDQSLLVMKVLDRARGIE